MSNKIIRTNYTSETTDFLREMEKDVQKNASPARNAEVKKYTRINELRDNEKAQEAANKLWSGF